MEAKAYATTSTLCQKVSGIGVIEGDYAGEKLSLGIPKLWSRAEGGSKWVDLSTMGIETPIARKAILTMRGDPWAHECGVSEAFDNVNLTTGIGKHIHLVNEAKGPHSAVRQISSLRKLTKMLPLFEGRGASIYRKISPPKRVHAHSR